jgi:redox-sensitive bicupin YhaK (pirin superfamily)
MSSTVSHVLKPKIADLGDFTVRRVLPQVGNRHVGPFIFFDHMGPVDFAPGKGIDVRPHPHIGLATVTYLFAGEIVHRDSLGAVQPIRLGDVNWMTAGRGIVHSERTGPELRASGGPVHGIQIWVGLPKRDEEAEPAFHHHPKDTLPTITANGMLMRIIVGTAFGLESPVRIHSPMFYVDVDAPAAGRVRAPDEFAERAIYVVEGGVSVEGQLIGTGEMAILAEGERALVDATGKSRFVMLGGGRLDGERHIWWNFVSSDKERIERAKADWKEGRFAGVPGETEFIPLPA